MKKHTTLYECQRRKRLGDGLEGDSCGGMGADAHGQRHGEDRPALLRRRQMGGEADRLCQWIAESTREHSRWEELNLPYGYLWWIADDNAFAAMGDSGNTIYVNREKKLVIAIASLFKENTGDRMDFIKECVEPMFA